MNLRFKIFILLIGLLHCHILIAQRGADSLIKKFNAYRTHSVQEKIYIHTSQNFYLTGETLWFKVYTVDGSFHKPLAVSKVAYVEILNKDNVPVLQAKISLKNGEGSGTFYLPASFVSGNYRLRAYTRWMRNFDAGFFFEKQLTIVNTFRKLESEITSGNPEYMISFFPEGGHLVDGVRSKIAFRITDKSGKGANLNGAILNSDKDTIITFKSLKFGIGHFMMTPEKKEQYLAVFKDQNGNVFSNPFSPVQETGYVMSVTDHDNRTISVTVTASADIKDASEVLLFAHSRQKITKAEMRYVHNTATFLINKQELSDGISHLTIFDSNMRPLCERLYFKKPETSLHIEVRSESQQYEKRRKVVLQINTTCSGNKNPASLSVSVYRKDSLETNFPSNILHYLLLSSDLKGTIESPEYYFGNDAGAGTAVDDLMLTHGWRRFKWDDILIKKPAIRYVPETNAHIITACVVNNADSSNAGVLTYLSVPGKVSGFYASVSDDDGHVQFEANDLYGPKRIILQTDQRKDSIYSVKPQSPFSDEVPVSLMPSFSLTPPVRKELLLRSVAMQVQDIYHGKEINRFTDPYHNSLPFYGYADAAYNLDAYTRFPVMEEVMREYVPEVVVRKRKDGFHFMVLDNVHKTVFQQDPLILMDGVPVFDADKIMTLDPVKVKKLEVITSRYYLGALTFPGIVSYSTYQGDLDGFTLDAGSVSLDYEGLQLKREFYHPHFDNQEQGGDRVPDKRHLLYWNPAVKTGVDGLQKLEFHTSDVTGNFIVLIEGITKEGYPGGAVYPISVE